MFTQIVNPMGNLLLTWIIAAIPVVALLILLAVIRLSAWAATLIGSIITFLLGLYVWRMPLGDGMLAYLYGSATGVWNVDWITFWGVMLFNTLVLTGVFDRFRRWLLAQGTEDVRVQAILFAWAFGALLEGLVGFGYPWAVVAPILITLGIPDLDALRVAAIVNELVLLGMRVSRRRLTIGQNPNKIDAVILEPCMIAEAPGIALALSLPERLGIAGCVALRHIGWPEYLRYSCHGRLLVGSAYATSLADRPFQFQPDRDTMQYCGRRLSPSADCPGHNRAKASGCGLPQWAGRSVECKARQYADHGRRRHRDGHAEKAEELSACKQGGPPQGAEARFASNSPLEGDGFELSVPRSRKFDSVWRWEAFRAT